MSAIDVLIERQAPVAVLTGDIVGSSRLDPDQRKAIHHGLGQISDTLRARLGISVPYDVDVFRGDSWQLLIVEPRLALRAAVFIRAALRSTFESARIDTRVAIGVGSIDFLPENGVSTGDGSAFRHSGEALEGLGRSHRMAFADAGSREREECLDALVKLVDFPATWWTARQAHAVSRSLFGRTQEEIAADWPGGPVTQQAVAQHLARAGWHAVDTALSFFEHAFTE